MALQRVDIQTPAWDEYELLDSGDGRKLERFNTIITDRPDPQALWDKKQLTQWVDAHASFTHDGKWKKQSSVPDEWTVSYQGITLILSCGSFKHLGMFPEHAAQWNELTLLAKKYPGMTVLNMFGYTGAASLAAAAAGAQVTHVDASRQTIQVVKENTARSGLASDAIRLVCEDALKYAKRLVSRGETFDVIVMDPPAFGRGPKGEVWKIEEKLSELIDLIPQLLSPGAHCVILNGYAAGYSARTFGELLHGALGSHGGSITYGDVGICESQSDRILSTGIYARWDK